MTAPLWRPSPQRISDSNMTRYMAWLESEQGRDFGGDYQALWQWSTDDIEGFWTSIWDFFGVRHSCGWTEALAGEGMPAAEWFTGARLNYAENLLAGRPPDRLALQHASELRELAALDWGELQSEVARLASALRQLGVGANDRVAAYMPNLPETLVAFLACASIGAIWSCCSPDFGARTVADRFAQIEPKVLLAVDGYRYAGRSFDRRGVVAGLVADLPTVEHTVVFPYLEAVADLRGLPGAVEWDELRERGDPRDFTYEQVPFDHPLWVLYSSGTTGLPKPIVHSHGGILLEQLKTSALHVDAQAADRVFWFTTTGWMMWNFLVGVLLSDASIVLYDGSPAHPDLGALWDLAEQAGVTCFGSSPGYLAACGKAELEPRAGRDLSRLRSVGSTGSPLSPAGFQWVYDSLGPDTWLFSTSGGTDVCAALVGGVPILPVHAGELQGRALGCAVEAWDDDGRPLTDQVGELVITRPMPSMPIYLWGDPDGSRYRASYFDVFPGTWRHRDWIEVTSRGTAIVYGRSDATINRSGVRMGTSEIYRAVAAIDEVTDALVVDVPKPGTEGWMPLFVVLADRAGLTDELVAKIEGSIREQCSPRHVPDRVYAVAEIPRTLSGKLLEVPVKRILTGTPVHEAADPQVLANPGSLDWFAELELS